MRRSVSPTVASAIALTIALVAMLLGMSLVGWCAAAVGAGLTLSGSV